MTVVAATVMLLVTGCVSKYDDAPIWNEIDSIYDRIEKLEDLCRDLNNDIESLKTLVNAVQNNDYVTSVSPITKGGETIGYTINFAKGESITIYHGEDGEDGKDGKDGEDGEDGRDGRDGKDGYTPKIGVKLDTDGLYYWTVDSEWLLDSYGNKVPATGANGEDGKDGVDGKDGKDGVDGEDGKDGKDGKDGVTPVLKIENDYWYISYDNGATWTELGKATGEDGKDGADGEDGINGEDGKDGKDGDSMFKSVTQDEENVYFELADGTIITIPLASSNALYRLQSISYVPAYSDGKALVEFTTQADSYVVMDFELAPKDVAADIAKDWKALLSMKAVNVATRSSELINMEILSCKADNQGIITVKASGKELGDQFFMGSQYMSARLEIADDSFNHKSEYVPIVTVNHASTEPIIPVEPSAPKIKDNEIWYTTTDENAIEIEDGISFGANIVSNVYNGDKGVITFDANVTKIGQYAFDSYKTLKSVVLPNLVTNIEFKAFYECTELIDVHLGESIEIIGQNSFSGCTHLKAINFPEKLEYINGSAFWGCDSLTEITLPDSLKELDTGAFANCKELANVDLGEGVKTLDSEAFTGCIKLKSITIPNSVTSIRGNCFSGCSILEDVVVGDGVVTIGYRAFYDCNELTTVHLGKNIIKLDSGAFMSCSHLTTINFPERLEEISSNAFDGCAALTSITLPNSLQTIGSAAFMGCERLASRDCGEGVTTIGSISF